MRIAAVLASTLVTVALGLLATPTLAQDKAAKAAVQKPAAVPADVRARVVSKLQGATAEDVSASPIPGLYEVTMGGLIAYVTADGKYLVSGNVYDLDTQANLTATRRNAARAKALAAASEDKMIVFSPPNPKMTVTVFTDIDCGFCRKFHNQVAEMNKAGVRVRYLMYPRTGPGTESWRKAESVWCAADRRDAITRAKRGEDVKRQNCPGTAVDRVRSTRSATTSLSRARPRSSPRRVRLHRRLMTPALLVHTVQVSKAATAVRGAPVRGGGVGSTLQQLELVRRLPTPWRPAGASSFSVITGHLRGELRVQGLDRSAGRPAGSSSEKIASAGHSGSHSVQSMHSSGSMTSKFGPSWKQSTGHTSHTVHVLALDAVFGDDKRHRLAPGQ